MGIETNAIDFDGGVRAVAVDRVRHPVRREERGGASALEQAIALGVLVVLGLMLSRALPAPSLRVLLASHMPLWVPASFVVFWRWGWALLHWLRAGLYRYVVYPRLQRRASIALEQRPISEIAIVLATFKERPEVTERVLHSVMAELERVEGLVRRPLLVAVTGSDGDDVAITRAYTEARRWLRPDRVPELVLLRGADGKRDALGKGLTLLLESGLDADGAFVMMDGDTQLEPGALTRALPLFRLEPPVYAVTTNEHAHVSAPNWFCEWIHLRHAQRHLYNCSIALSDRLLCLTGRYSVFRAGALDRGFIEIVRNDSVRNWLWGRYQLLSGDDKSTWFHLLSQGRRLLYVPDACVITHEVVTGSSLVRGYHNLRRWGGNMMRNSGRAISVGPRRLGMFCWWCLIDQRITVWTTLIGPTALCYMLNRQRSDLAAAYLLWVLLSRTVRVVPAWFHGRRLSFFYAPVAVFSDWSGALIKIWVMFFPARQFWLNRGGRELDSTRGRSHMRDRRLAAGLTLATTLVVYVLGVGQLIGSISLTRDLGIVLGDLFRDRAAFWVAAATVVAIAVLLAARIRNADTPPAPETKKS